MGQYVKVAKKSELPQQGGTCVEVEGNRVALFHVDGQVYAIGDMCTHEDAPLSEGEVEDGEVTCPWHGATFKLDTGACTGPPADEDVPSYNVRVNGDDVEIEV